MNIVSRRLRALGVLPIILLAPTMWQGILQARPAESAPEPVERKINTDVARIVKRSDIVLQRANTKPEEAMPLGNGRLGVAVWAEGGCTAQLNRADTLPYRRSPGQVTIPGLKKLATATDYTGKLDLYNGEFTERGAGMSATFSVQPDADVFAIEVTGANPDVAQSATLHLWAPRRPGTYLQTTMGVLFETWRDSEGPGASGATFGSLAAITARARAVHVESAGPVGVRLSFLPNRDGTFRLMVAAPHWAGGNALDTAKKLLPSIPNFSPEKHRLWWNDFWRGLGLFKMASKDGAAEYMENLRTIDLYAAAAERGDIRPGSHAGVADLFSAFRDFHRWDPAAYWHFNLRMQVAANLGAGAFALNESYFRLYRDNLQNIEAWTKAHMKGRPGVCVPETMRFNGQGYEKEEGAPLALDCDADFKPYYNARTLTTGAEISLWIWRQYLATQDEKFLAANYSLMADAARFLLAYATVGKDHLRHTFPSNAHENQWDVRDPATDIAASQSLFPMVVKAATVLKTDADLVKQLRSAMQHLPPFPRSDQETLTKLLTPAADSRGNDAIALSYEPTAPIHNTENVGLEPVWPYSLIGDDGPLHKLAIRTYEHRPNKLQNDWSFDPIQAARLGLRSEVKASLIGLTEKYQAYPSGLAKFIGPEFYGEQIGVVADTLQEALAQNYNGLLRIASAWPREWDVDATVYLQRHGKVDVQMRSGVPATVTITAGFTGTMRIRNPWPGKTPEMFAQLGRKRVDIRLRGGGTVVEAPVKAGMSYALQPIGRGKSFVVALLQEGAAAGPRSLGTRSIGLLRAQK